MAQFLVSYYEPMQVMIEAENEDAARELFLEGEFDGEKPNTDGEIHEDFTVILFSK